MIACANSSQVAGEGSELPLSVSFPPADPGPLGQRSVHLKPKILKDPFISAAPLQHPEALASKTDSALLNRFGTDMQLRAGEWSAHEAFRNDSFSFET